MVAHLTVILRWYDEGKMSPRDAAVMILATLKPGIADVVLREVGNRVEVLQELLRCLRSWKRAPDGSSARIISTWN